MKLLEDHLDCPATPEQLAKISSSLLKSNHKYSWRLVVQSSNHNKYNNRKYGCQILFIPVKGWKINMFQTINQVICLLNMIKQLQHTGSILALLRSQRKAIAAWLVFLWFLWYFSPARPWKLGESQGRYHRACCASHIVAGEVNVCCEVPQIEILMKHQGGDNYIKPSSVYNTCLQDLHNNKHHMKS